MKSHMNKVWMLIVLAIIGNIIIFSFLSNKLENYVFAKVVDSKTLEDF